MITRTDNDDSSALALAASSPDNRPASWSPTSSTRFTSGAVRPSVGNARALAEFAQAVAGGSGLFALGDQVLQRARHRGGIAAGGDRGVDGRATQRTGGVLRQGHRR